MGILHKCVLVNDLSFLQRALKTESCFGPTFESVDDEVKELGSPHFGLTPLQLASKLGRERMIIPLVQKGANVNRPASSAKRATPLHLAAENGHVITCETLLRIGADANAPDCSSGLTPLMRAAQNGHFLCCKMLLKEEAGHGCAPTCLHEHKHIRARPHLHVHASAHTDPNLTGKKRHHSALRFSAEKGFLEIVALLIECRANVQGKDGVAALNFAAKLGHADVCRLLLASGSDVHTEYNGKTAWERAMEAGHIEVCTVLGELSSSRPVDWIASINLPRARLGPRRVCGSSSITSYSNTATSKSGSEVMVSELPGSDDEVPGRWPCGS